MIKEDYVSFEIAKLLKDKGFYSEDCFAFYKENGEIGFLQTFGDIADYDSETCVIAPTLQMAMKWLREAHNLYVEVYTVKNYGNKTVEYCITIEDLNFPGSDDGFDIRPSHESYEEACEAAIKYCLENLI